MHELKHKNYFTDHIFNIDQYKPGPSLLNLNTFSKDFNKTEIVELAKKDDKSLKLLKLNGYLKDNVENFPTYECNKYGFRGDDWDAGEKGAIFLGCSDIFGIGNHYEETASCIVAKELGVKNYNLGTPAGGFDQVYRCLKYYIKDINADTVFFLIPEASRRELYTFGNHPLTPSFMYFDGIGAHMNINEEEYRNLRDFYFKYLCNDTYMFLETNKSLDAIRYLCMSENKRLIEIKNPYFYDDYKDTCQFPIDENDIAADLVHRGKKFQKQIADTFIKKNTVG